MERFLLISLGALLGANARYWVGLWAAHRLGVAFPYGTLIVNVTGSFLLGMLYALTAEGLGLPPQLRLLVGVGFLGAFTTFSSYAVESTALLQGGSSWLMLLNMAANNLGALAAALTGVLLARWLTL